MTTILYQAQPRRAGLRRAVSVWIWDEETGPTAIRVNDQFSNRMYKQRVREILLEFGYITKSPNAPSGAMVWNDSHIRYFELE